MERGESLPDLHEGIQIIEVIKCGLHGGTNIEQCSKDRGLIYSPTLAFFRKWKDYENYVAIQL